MDRTAPLLLALVALTSSSACSTATDDPDNAGNLLDGSAATISAARPSGGGGDAGTTTPASGSDASVQTGAADAGDANQASDGGATGDAAVDAGLAPMPVISRGAPAFASSGMASDGNDADYTTCGARARLLDQHAGVDCLRPVGSAGGQSPPGPRRLVFAGE